MFRSKPAMPEACRNDATDDADDDVDEHGGDLDSDEDGLVDHRHDDAREVAFWRVVLMVIASMCVLYLAGNFSFHTAGVGGAPIIPPDALAPDGSTPRTPASDLRGNAALAEMPRVGVAKASERKERAPAEVEATAMDSQSWASKASKAAKPAGKKRAAAQEERATKHRAKASGARSSGADAADDGSKDSHDVEGDLGATNCYPSAS